MRQFTPYQRGFFTKCAEAGVNEDLAVALYKRALDLNIPDNYAGNMGLGAIAGGLYGLGEAAMSDDEDKSYVKTALKRALMGAGLLAGATYLGAPNLMPAAKQKLMGAKDAVVPPVVNEAVS